MEIKEINKTKKNWLQKFEEERRKTKQLELEEKRRKEEEQKKVLKIKTAISIILGVIGSIMMILGSVLGSESGNTDSGWYVMSFIGMFVLISIPIIWVGNPKNKKKK